MPPTASEHTTMKTPFFLSAVALSLLCSGCVGTGPNTQRGAVTGGALGAIAGAIIGNNSGHGNGGRGAVIGAVAGAIAGGTMGNQTDHEQGTIYGSEREATTNVVVQELPASPPPYEEVVAARPVPEAVWVRGHWDYAGHGRYVWTNGRWEVPPPQRQVYVAPHWEHRADGYIYIQGYWRS